MKTTLILTIEHKKPLPEGATDIVAQRFYGWAYSKGVEVGVTVKRLDEFCGFPNCSCPMDPGPDPDWCALGYPHIRSSP